MDLPGEYSVSATFNVSDLVPFDYEGGDLRANPFEEGGNDAKDLEDHSAKNGIDMKNSALKENEESYVRPKPTLDPLSYNGGPITRARAKKMKEAIVGLILPNLEPMLNSQSQQVKGQSQLVKGQGQLMDPSPSPTLVHVIQVIDAPKSISKREA